MKRALLIVLLGVAFLFVVTALGTFVTNSMPTMNTPGAQTSQAGPYTVTLRVDPNPPPTDRPATFSVQIVQEASRRPVNGANVTLAGALEDMGLSTSVIAARASSAGTYVARVPFSMSGSWQIQISIALPGQPTVTAVFNVTAR
ncbi:MAG TPA: FixH family protein [Ktedonobacteraceae bacterium]|jgi:hypothetical protein